MVRLSYGRLLAALVIFAVAQAATAQSVATPCLTREEAEPLITYALPTVVTRVKAHCTPHLPATSALVQTGALIAARYQNEADQAWPPAALAIDKMAGLKIANVMGETGVKGFLKTTLLAGLTKGIKPQDCPTADRFINAVQPLPARNVAALIILLFETNAQNKQSLSSLPFCPVNGAPK